jgi:2-methylcitrate dehydratase PrpD
MADYLEKIAQFAAEFSYQDLPASTVERTRQILADSIAAIVGGAAEPEISALSERLCATSKGGSVVLGTAKTADPAIAALLNGSAGTFLEMDEGNQFCKGHPGMHTIPATYAASESRAASGLEFLAAIAIGYELGARVGIATSLRPSMHPHGTWGAICAAVGIGRLSGFDAARMRTLLNISSNMCLATSKPTMLEGGTVRNMYAGIAGQLGSLACTLVETGFTGERDGIANVFGRVVSDTFSCEVMTRQLGERWEVTRNYFKLHSCCRYNHAALDALAIIANQHPQVHNPVNIARIDVKTYSLAAELDNQSPANTLAAKFSLPFAIATTLIHRSSDVPSFTWDAVRNAVVQDLAKRVNVLEDPAMSAKLPHERPAALKITLVDGSILEASTRTNRGDWRDPYTRDELREKYQKLTTRLWDRQASTDVYQEIMNLDQAQSLKPLGALIARAEKSIVNTSKPSNMNSKFIGH